MDRDTAVARIQQGLGFRQDLNDQIVGALKEARRLLETGRSLPDFLLQEGQTLLLPAGNADVPLPTGFIMEFQEEGLWYVKALGFKETIWLEKLDFDIGNTRFVRSDPGSPLAYTLRGSKIHFWPARDVAYTLNWAYYKRSKDLSTNVPDNEWLADDAGAPEALIGRAGMIIAADLADTAAVQKFSSMYTISWNGISAMSNQLDEENRPLAVGSRL